MFAKVKNTVRSLRKRRVTDFLSLALAHSGYAHRMSAMEIISQRWQLNSFANGKEIGPVFPGNMICSGVQI